MHLECLLIAFLAPVSRYQLVGDLHKERLEGGIRGALEFLVLVPAQRHNPVVHLLAVLREVLLDQKGVRGNELARGCDADAINDR